MNYSLFTADRLTHLKIVVVALVAATAIAGFGISARLANPDVAAATSMHASSGVVKASKTTVTAVHEGSSMIR